MRVGESPVNFSNELIKSLDDVVSSGSGGFEVWDAPRRREGASFGGKNLPMFLEVALVSHQNHGNTIGIFDTEEL